MSENKKPRYYGDIKNALRTFRYHDKWSEMPVGTPQGKNGRPLTGYDKYMHARRAGNYSELAELQLLNRHERSFAVVNGFGVCTCGLYTDEPVDFMTSKPASPLYLQAGHLFAGKATKLFVVTELSDEEPFLWCQDCQTATPLDLPDVWEYDVKAVLAGHVCSAK